MSGFSKSITSISSSLAKFGAQLAGAVKLVRLHFKKLYNPEDMGDAEMSIRAALLGGTYIPPETKLGILKSKQSRKTSGSSAGAAMPNLLVGDTPQAGTSARSMPLYKNQLIRWGGAALGSKAIAGVGDYMQATGSKYADAVTAGGMMLQGAAIGAGAGAMLGPQGAAIGALLGTAIAATDKLFDTWTQRAREA